MANLPEIRPESLPLDAMTILTPRGHFWMGNLLMTLGHPIQARPFYRKAVENGVEISMSLNNLALIAVAEGHFDDALQLLTGAIRIKRDPLLVANLRQILRSLPSSCRQGVHFEAALRATAGD